MSKAVKKKLIPKKDEPLKIFGSFEDVIKVSVGKKSRKKKSNDKSQSKN